MSRGRRTLLGVVLMPLLALTVWAGLRRGAEHIRPRAEAHRPTATYPDYSAIVIPPNVAPLNLQVLEPGRKFCLRFSAGVGDPVEVFSMDGNMRIRAAAWRTLLAANSGGELRLDIYVKDEAGWVHFDTVRNRIAAEEIDPYVVYRYIPPIYSGWYQISLRQRDLRNFDERVLFDNQLSPAATAKAQAASASTATLFSTAAPNRC